MKLSKTKQAFNQLTNILKEISDDGEITLEEFRRVLKWRDDWKTVTRRPELKLFDNWLNEAISDRIIDKNERDELIEWAKKISEKFEVPSIKVEDFNSGDDYLDFPRNRRPTWRSDPATAKQVAFLIDLGEPESACRGLSKGQASERIDELLATQHSRISEKSGCLGLILFMVLPLLWLLN